MLKKTIFAQDCLLEIIGVNEIPTNAGQTSLFADSDNKVAQTSLFAYPGEDKEALTEDEEVLTDGSESNNGFD